MLILALASIALAPPNFRDLQPGDQFKFAWVSKYLRNLDQIPPPTQRTRTITYSSTPIGAWSCLKERPEIDTYISPNPRLGNQLHESLIYTFWRRTDKFKGLILAYSDSDKPPRIVRTLAFHDTRDPKTGATWSEKYASSDGWVTSMHSKAIRWETITVPAGKFLCLVVRTTGTASRQGLTKNSSGTAWWSPKTGGYVKIDDADDHHIGKTWQLTSYHLAPEK